MIYSENMLNSEILALLAARLKSYRLAARISQSEMARKSGVGLSTISHFEQGKNLNITLNNFISLLRVIGQQQNLVEMLPELPMPLEVLEEINRLMPKRARGRKKKYDRQT